MEYRRLTDFKTYRVYEDGRIYSERSDKFLKHHVTKGGYHTLGLRKDSISETCTITVAQIVARAYIENPRNLPEVDHLDKDTHNNHYSNLRWVTKKQNYQGVNKSKFGCIFKVDDPRRTKQWVASATIDKRRNQLYFLTKEEAYEGWLDLYNAALAIELTDSYDV